MAMAKRIGELHADQHAGQTLWTAAIDADGAASAIRRALRGTLSPSEANAVAARRPLAVSSGPPDRAAVRAVATLATADAAAVLALHLAPPGGDPNLLAATTQVVCASHIGIQALRAPAEPQLLRELGHIAGYAAHLAAEAVAAAEQRRNPWRFEGGRTPTAVALPRSWEQLLQGLTHRLVFDPPSDPADHAAADGAYHGALHAFRELSGARGLRAGALLRFTRLTALAAAYAGWALVL